VGKKTIILFTTAAVAVAAITAVAANRFAASTKQDQGALLCRAQVYLQKAEGGVSELSWIELWEMTRTGRGFDCTAGDTLEARIRFSEQASEDDRRVGARIFGEQCARCHGSDGSGGFAPSLTRSEYSHGDTDLAIYRVLRNGVPGTAMPRANLPPLALLEVLSHLRALQASASENQESDTYRLAIQVSGERLKAAGSKADEWLMYSGSYNGWRHTSLTEITPANVAKLGVRWVKQFDMKGRGSESTPLVIDGTIFTVPDPEHVVALDARTGRVIWEYKRPLPVDFDMPGPFGPVNRGLAAYGSALFLGSSDGHLVAINANDGEVIWQTLIASPSQGYSITGAPLVVNHSVIVGITGGEFRTRGFLAAYDAFTGQQQWKFDTIPGPGQIGHETWENDAWRKGGGPTWVTGSYDPSSDLLFWGVGNPNPDYNGDVRPGDNLFTDSVIALHASTGKLAWYFQFTPHDEHDRDAAQTPILTDLLIDGVVRKVICWPNRNGFYYVLDRITGEFLTGVPFVEIDWAKGLTSKGRPILSNIDSLSRAEHRSRPGIAGATNWQNPAFDPRLGTIFVPTLESSSTFTNGSPNEAENVQGGLFLGSGWTQTAQGIHKVVALDAATGGREWAYTAPAGNDYDYSGLLSTDGGLVFGASGGVCFALDSETGRELWRLSLDLGTKSAPISFTIDGQQVIVVSAGRALFLLGL
jgi:alcohol dehydrogenase (cytochrome c)